MKKIILASLLAATVASTAFADTAPSVLSGTCQAFFTDESLSSVTFTAPTPTGSIDVPTWLSKLGAMKVKEDVAGRILRVAVKGCAKTLYCEQVEDQVKSSKAQVVCAVSEEVLAAKQEMAEEAVECYNANHQ